MTDITEFTSNSVLMCEWYFTGKKMEMPLLVYIQEKSF